MDVREMRTNQVNIRLSDDEAERAEKVAEHFGLNLANLFRMLVKEKAVALGIDAGTKPEKKQTKR